ncbi:MAG: YfcC family protein, partial [Eggerthellaceae bacterium]|nr:YfcC family protein [Eggerthellaceae bacterium]
MEKAKKKRASLSALTILMAILVVLAIITVIMAAAGVEGITGATLSGLLTAPVRGWSDALSVNCFIMILGGFLGVVTATGALNVGIDTLVRKLHGKEIWIIPILMILFSVGGTVYGMGEETVPFYILLASTMVAAGFDSMVGVGTVLLGAGCGVLGSTVNPFAVGVAVDALKTSGVEANQAIIIVLGAILWIVATAMAIMFMVRYAKKVKADKGSTILSLQEQEEMRANFGEVTTETSDVCLSGRQKGVLIVFAITFVV